MGSQASGQADDLTILSMELGQVVAKGAVGDAFNVGFPVDGSAS